MSKENKGDKHNNGKRLSPLYNIPGRQAIIPSCPLQLPRPLPWSPSLTFSMGLWWLPHFLGLLLLDFLAPCRLYLGTVLGIFHWFAPSPLNPPHNLLLLPTLVLGTPVQHLPSKNIWTYFFVLSISPLPFFLSPSLLLHLSLSFLFEAHIFSLNNHFSFPSSFCNLVWKLTHL